MKKCQGCNERGAITGIDNAYCVPCWGADRPGGPFPSLLNIVERFVGGVKGEPFSMPQGQFYVMQVPATFVEAAREALKLAKSKTSPTGDK